MKILKKSRILQYCVTATLSFCLTGCMGIYEGGFECPAGTGVGCKSISEVNVMVDEGELPRGEFPKIQVEPPTPINYEIWYAPRSSNQWSDISNQKDLSEDLDTMFSPKKESRKKAYLSDV